MQVFMNLVNTGLAAELDQSSMGTSHAGAHAPCLVSIIHPNRGDADAQLGQSGQLGQRERHGCLSFLSVGSSTIFQGDLLCCDASERELC